MKEKIVIRKHPRIVEGIRTFGNRSMVDQRVLVPRVIGSSPISRSKQNIWWLWCNGSTTDCDSVCSSSNLDFHPNFRLFMTQVQQDKETIVDSLGKEKWFRTIGIGINKIFLRVKEGFEEKAKQEVDSLGVQTPVVVETDFPVHAF